MKTSHTFYDIEHDGDKTEIYEALRQLGAKILNEDFNYEAEQWWIEVELNEKIENFWGKVEEIVSEAYN